MSEKRKEDSQALCHAREVEERAWWNGILAEEACAKAIREKRDKIRVRLAHHLRRHAREAHDRAVQEMESLRREED